MTPSTVIGRLNRALRRFGEDVQLQRPASPTTPATFAATADCRGFVRSEAQVGIVRVILSPTDLIETGWPGATGAAVGDQLVPKKTDKIFVQGRQRTLEAVRPTYMDGVLVRVELDASA